MQGMLEKEIEKILVEEVRKLGGRAYKFVSPGNSGVPDRIVIFPDGRVIFVELKTSKGALTQLQQVQIKRLCNLGQTVMVVKGLEGVIDFFQEYGYLEVAERLRKKHEKRGNGK